jgi:TATA-box binding protein (TBP) (component of TFIID and TFIIIB)
MQPFKTSRNGVYEVETYNVLGTLRIMEPDIEKIATRLEDCIYDPQSSPSLDVYRGRCLFRIYPTGMIMCFGRSRDEVTRSASKLFASLRNTGVKVPRKLAVDFRSETSVMRLQRRLRLWKALYLLKDAEISTRGPRLLTYRLNDPKVTLQLFEDGVIICLGARNNRESRQAYAHIMRIIDGYGLLSDRVRHQRTKRTPECEDK